MTNPAADLLEILEGWKHGDGKSAQQARKRYAQSQEQSEADVERRAMALYLEVVDRVADLEAQGVRVDAYRAALPRWHQGILRAITKNDQVPAKGTRVEPALPTQDLDFLDALSSIIDVHQGYSELGETQRTALESALDEVTSLIQDVDLGEAHRAHLLGLLSAVRRAVRKGRIDLIRENVETFLGATVMFEGAGVAEDPGFWAGLRAKFLTPTVAGASGNLLAQGANGLAGFIGQL